MSLFDLKAQYRAGALTKPAYIAAMHELHAGLFDYAEFMRATDIARIEIRDGAVVMTSRRAGIKMACDPLDWRMAPIEILNFGVYEQAEWEMMARLIEPGATVFDIGANIGWYSMNIALQAPTVQIHAFEPLPSTYRYLAQNVALNGLSNVHLHPFGFSNCAGWLDFYFYPEGSVNASAADLGSSPNKRKLTCQVRTLDDFTAETGLPVDFIKCDVEGAEVFVFQGGLATLRRQQPVIFTEMLRKWSAAFGYHPNDIIALLAGIGYRCFAAQDGRLVPFAAMDESTMETNFFFLHPERHRHSLEALSV